MVISKSKLGLLNTLENHDEQNSDVVGELKFTKSLSKTSFEKFVKVPKTSAGMTKYYNFNNKEFIP